MHRLIARLPHQAVSTSLSSLSRLSRRLHPAPLLAMHSIGSNITGLDLPRPVSTLCHAPAPARPPLLLPSPHCSPSYARAAEKSSAACGRWQRYHGSPAVSAGAATAAASASSTLPQQLSSRKVAGQLAQNSGADGDDDFLSPSATFGSLGLHLDVVAALEAAGLQRPSQVRPMACGFGSE